jgi:hypothetical protein
MLSAGLQLPLDASVSDNSNILTEDDFVKKESRLRMVADLTDTENGEPFYSQIERTVENFRQEKMSADQALAMIKKTAGVNLSENKKRFEFTINRDIKTLS